MLKKIMSKILKLKQLKVPSLRGRAADIIDTKLPGTLKLLKHLPNLHPINETCGLNAPFFCVKHVLSGI